MKMTIEQLIDDLEFIQEKFELNNLYVYLNEKGLEFIDESLYNIGVLELYIKEDSC
ncbi:hypothetical protein KQI18_04160 [Clostridioides mangenotii]|uniref:hypothetical protein n=1 Tax=Metaclostridioides mangenotii TaxID=1540 RepID=UPI001C1019A2|nr:hypothetical protein [Clostridioides mangenotii]MBU5306975.1 hypothetical protein [Clostridioides mangenotii]